MVNYIDFHIVRYSERRKICAFHIRLHARAHTHTEKQAASSNESLKRLYFFRIQGKFCKSIYVTSVIRRSSISSFFTPINSQSARIRISESGVKKQTIQDTLQFSLQLKSSIYIIFTEHRRRFSIDIVCRLNLHSNLFYFSTPLFTEVSS
jgi:hypothetical protein